MEKKNEFMNFKTEKLKQIKQTLLSPSYLYSLGDLTRYGRKNGFRKMWEMRKKECIIYCGV